MVARRYQAQPGKARIVNPPIPRASPPDQADLSIPIKDLVREGTIVRAPIFLLMSVVTLAVPLAAAAQPVANKAARSSSDEPSGQFSPERISAHTEFLRALMATSMDAAPRAMPLDDLRIVTAAFGPPTQDRDIVASWLMRGGQVAATREGLSGIYNPLADAWLLLGWQAAGDDSHIVWAALVQGSLLRAPNERDWIMASDPVGEAMQRTTSQSIAAFAALPQSLGTAGLVELVEAYRGLQGTLVLDRVRQMGGAMARWSLDNPAAIGRVRKALDKGGDAGLATLPGPVRETLAPMAVVTGAEGDVLVLQSARDPARAVLVRATGGRAAPQFRDIPLHLTATQGTAP